MKPVNKQTAIAAILRKPELRSIRNNLLNKVVIGDRNLLFLSRQGPEKRPTLLRKSTLLADQKVGQGRQDAKTGSSYPAPPTPSLKKRPISLPVIENQ
jgi:hypothetical protein